MLKVFKKKSNEMKPNARYLTQKGIKRLNQQLRLAAVLSNYKKMKNVD